MHAHKIHGVSDPLCFVQLYILSEEPGRKEFLDNLFAYMQQNGKMKI